MYKSLVETGSCDHVILEALRDNIATRYNAEAKSELQEKVEEAPTMDESQFVLTLDLSITIFMHNLL